MDINRNFESRYNYQKFRLRNGSKIFKKQHEEKNKVYNTIRKFNLMIPRKKPLMKDKQKLKLKTNILK